MAASDFVQHSRPLAWLRPIDAYRLLRDAGEAPLLLDGAGRHPEARWSFIGLNPLVMVEIDGTSITETWADGAIEAAHEDPLAYLARTTAAYSFPLAEAAPFTGGWVGAFAFGFARAVEPSLPPAGPGPDAVLRLCRDAIAFDHLAGTATAFSADLGGDAAACEGRLETIARALGAGPAGRAPPAPASPASAPWAASLDEAAFCRAVRRLKERIVDGDLFQANLATRFSAPAAADPADLFEALQQANPSPFAALLDLGDTCIVSNSPEQLFAVAGGLIRSRPIAGTRKRGATPAEDAAMEGELLSDEKERAEHTMLVDLVRNDVAKVSRPGSVRVAERMSVERYRNVMHLVSRVEGRVREGTGPADWLAALFPGGTVTGAPKVRACQRILEEEPAPRGFYTGSAGYVSWSGNAQWNILIRGLVIQAGTAHVHAGSGIVADSDPRREWKEAQRKAQAMLEAAAGALGASLDRVGEVSPHGSWSPPTPARRVAARVLLLDNYDSFVHNLADYCAALGAEVRVVRHDADWRAAMAAWAPTHVVLSPGPGWPEEASGMMRLLAEWQGRIPILGVCLGHQAIAAAAGATVRRHAAGPVHGKPAAVVHAGAGLFAGLPSPIDGMRYHSLVVDGDTLPGGWHVDARLADGTVMALRHAAGPTFGLQFHPESLCTPRGLELLERFLRT